MPNYLVLFLHFPYFISFCTCYLFIVFVHLYRFYNIQYYILYFCTQINCIFKPILIRRIHMYARQLSLTGPLQPPITSSLFPYHLLTLHNYCQLNTYIHVVFLNYLTNKLVFSVYYTYIIIIKCM